MKKQHIIYSIIFLCACQFATVAVSQTNDWQKDSAFFRLQKGNYQTWLDESGLGKVLTIKKLDITKTPILMRLTFNYTAEDSAVWAWKRLKKDYEHTNSITLETALFLKMAHLMELDFNQIALNVRNKHVPSDLPSVDVDIFLDSLNKKIAVEGNFRSEVKDSVDIPAYRLPKQYHHKDTIFKVLNSPDDLQDFVARKLAEKFDQYFAGKTDIQFKKAPLRNPFVYTVYNIKSVVVPPRFWGINPRELLTYKVIVKKNEEKIKVICFIDGKYGSGLFVPQLTTGYGDMFPKYREELVLYAGDFMTNVLSKWIEEIFNK